MPSQGQRFTPSNQGKTAVSFNKPSASGAQDQTTTSIPVTKHPTRLHCICAACGHQGSALVYLDKVSKLRCKKCGSRDSIIASRDSASRGWSRRRLGK